MNVYLMIVGVLSLVIFALSVSMNQRIANCQSKVPAKLQNRNTIVMLVSLSILVMTVSSYMCLYTMKKKRSCGTSGRGGKTVLDIVVALLGLLVFIMGIMMLSPANDVKECHLEMYIIIYIALGALVTGSSGFYLFQKHTDKFN